ncbi:2596_t:CDS:2, partial [Gigaspora margarita]
MSDTKSIELHNIMNDDEHLANVDYFTDKEGDIESRINTGTNTEIASLIINNSEKETSMLFTGKILANWHGQHYESNSSKKTGSKKILCPWHVNASCSKLKNPNSLVFINKIIDTHNHELSVDAITFEQEKKFSNEMINDIEFLTQHCRIGTTIQRRYLEAFKFTGGMIAISRIEGINACLKRLLYNSNISLCELMHEIHKLLDQEDKQNQYRYWKLTIPTVKNIVHANFLFMESLYYSASLLDRDIAFDNEAEIVISDAEEDYIENPKATLQQLLEIIEPDNINEIWEIKIEISLQENDKLMTYLYAIDKEKIDLTKKQTNIYEQKVLYGTLYGMYKKALQKALQTKSNSRRLIEVLQKFTNMDEDKEELSSSKDSTKRLKASHEITQDKGKQQRCKKCGNYGHYQKNYK